MAMDGRTGEVELPQKRSPLSSILLSFILLSRKPVP